MQTAQTQSVLAESVDLLTVQALESNSYVLIDRESTRQTLHREKPSGAVGFSLGLQSRASVSAS